MDATVSAMASEVCRPAARLYGRSVETLPDDLFVPPDALAVFLDAFEGPLDFLLYLIRKQNINILDIPMVALTTQYLRYIDAMTDARFELAADYLLMAAVLIDIKTRLLLPKPPSADEEEAADPRAELARRLLDYERVRKQAWALSAHPVAGIDFWPTESVWRDGDAVRFWPTASLNELAAAWAAVVARAAMTQDHQVSRERLSVRAVMVAILERLSGRPRLSFTELFDALSSVSLIVVHFLAVLELGRERLIDIAQTAPGSPLYLTCRRADDAARIRG